MTQRVAKLLSVPLEYPYHGRNNFYVRKCYDKYYQIVEKALMKTDKRCVTVTGTSGIGKSVFYAYFCERFRQAHPDVCVIATAYRTERNCGLAVYNGTDEPIHMSSFFFFDEMLRKALDDAKSAKKQTIFLCDGAPDTLYCGKSVVFTSPDEKWLRHADKYHCTYHMPLWTLDELQEAARELGLPLTNEDMEKRFEIFGGEARHCLFPEKRADFLVSMFEQKIDRIWNPDKHRRLLCDNDPDHRLVHIEANHYGHYQSSKLASPFEVRKLAERMLLLSNSSREAMQLFFSAAGLSTACFEYIAQVDAREAFQQDKLVAVACWNRQRLEKTRNDDVTTITSQHQRDKNMKSLGSVFSCLSFSLVVRKLIMPFRHSSICRKRVQVPQVECKRTLRRCHARRVVIVELAWLTRRWKPSYKGNCDELTRKRWLVWTTSTSVRFCKSGLCNSKRKRSDSKKD